MSGRRRILSALLVLACSTPAVLAETVVVRAGTAHTVAGDAIDNAVILIEDGKIAWVGQAARARIPRGATELRAAHVTPGIVDAHTVVGLAGALNSDSGQVQDQDQLETSKPVQPELRAIDAFNPAEDLVEFARSLGVTTIHTGHGPGAAISGQTLIAKTRGATVAETVIRPGAAVAATLGRSVSSNFDSPGTMAKNVSLLREALVQAQSYRDRQSEDDGPDRDLGMEVLARVLAGEQPLMITANTATQIATALRLQEEFGFRLWLDGAAEAYRMLEPIKAAGVPVILHGTMIRAGGDRKNASYSTAKWLSDAGIPFAIQSGYEGYVPKTRIVLFEAQVAVHAGLGEAAALRAITLEPARILGIDDRVGSIEAGKDADLVLFDGHPLEYTSHACKVLIEGRVVSDVCR